MKNQSVKIGDMFFTYINIDKEGNDYFADRRIELPMGHDFLNRFDPDTVIEVGSTLFNQFRHKHRVIDLYDTSHPQIINEDGAKYDYAGKNVLSVSTIEHFDDVQVEGVWRTGVVMTDRGFQTIKRIFETAEKYLITVPIGIHLKMDAAILNSDIPRIVLKRDKYNNWKKHNDFKDIQSFKYDVEFPCSSAIHVITNIDKYFADDSDGVIEVQRQTADVKPSYLQGSQIFAAVK